MNAPTALLADLPTVLRDCLQTLASVAAAGSRSTSTGWALVRYVWSLLHQAVQQLDERACQAVVAEVAACCCASPPLVGVLLRSEHALQQSDATELLLQAVDKLPDALQERAYRALHQLLAADAAHGSRPGALQLAAHLEGRLGALAALLHAGAGPPPALQPVPAQLALAQLLQRCMRQQQEREKMSDGGRPAAHGASGSGGSDGRAVGRRTPMACRGSAASPSSSAWPWVGAGCGGRGREGGSDAGCAAGPLADAVAAATARLLRHLLDTQLLAQLLQLPQHVPPSVKRSLPAAADVPSVALEPVAPPEQPVVAGRSHSAELAAVIPTAEALQGDAAAAGSGGGAGEDPKAAPAADHSCGLAAAALSAGASVAGGEGRDSSEGLRDGSELASRQDNASPHLRNAPSDGSRSGGSGSAADVSPEAVFGNVRAGVALAEGLVQAVVVGAEAGMAPATTACPPAWGVAEVGGDALAADLSSTASLATPAAGDGGSHDESLELGCLLAQLSCTHLVLSGCINLAGRLQVAPPGAAAAQTEMTPAGAAALLGALLRLLQPRSAGGASIRATRSGRRTTPKAAGSPAVAAGPVLPPSCAAYLVSMAQCALAAQPTGSAAADLRQLSGHAAALYGCAFQAWRDSAVAGGPGPQAVVAAGLGPRLEALLQALAASAAARAAAAEQEAAAARVEPRGEACGEASPSAAVKRSREDPAPAIVPAPASTQSTATVLHSDGGAAAPRADASCSMPPPLRPPAGQPATSVASDGRRKKRRVVPQATVQVGTAAAAASQCTELGPDDTAAALGIDTCTGQLAEARYKLLRGIAAGVGRPGGEGGVSWWQDDESWEAYIADKEEMVTQLLQDNVEEYDAAERARARAAPRAAATRGSKRRSAASSSTAPPPGPLSAVGDQGAKPGNGAEASLAWQLLALAALQLLRECLARTLAARVAEGGGSNSAPVGEWLGALFSAGQRGAALMEAARAVAPSFGRKFWTAANKGMKACPVGAGLLVLSSHLAAHLRSTLPPCRELVGAYLQLLAALQPAALAEEAALQAQGGRGMSPLQLAAGLVGGVLEEEGRATGLSPDSLTALLSLLDAPCGPPASLLLHCAALRALLDEFVLLQYDPSWLAASPVIFHPSWFAPLGWRQQRAALSAALSRVEALLAAATTVTHAAGSGGGTAAAVQFEGDAAVAAYDTLALCLDVVDSGEEVAGIPAPALLKRLLPPAMSALRLGAATASRLAAALEAAAEQRGGWDGHEEAGGLCTVLADARVAGAAFVLARRLDGVLQGQSAGRKLRALMTEHAAELRGLLLCQSEVAQLAGALPEGHELARRVKACIAASPKQQPSEAAPPQQHESDFEATATGRGGGKGGRQGGRRSANAYVEAALAEMRRHRPASAAEDEEDDYSDLEDFIVCKPGRDYGELLNCSFAYSVDNAA